MRVYRTMHLWHWISAAVCLAALLLFTITGITLNHAGAIGAQPVVTSREVQLPDALRAMLASGARTPEAVPDALAAWIEKEFGVRAARATAEWSDQELYLSAPRPGRDAWVSIDRATGATKAESTDRGWVAYFNDLHKGRNTGITWVVFIDVVAAACLFFAITGLVLLIVQARQRRSTWPLLSGGVVLLFGVMIFLAH